MTLEKAIEVFTHTLTNRKLCFTEDYFNAAKLGIEALELVKSSREWNPTIPCKLLPGEIEE